MAFAIVAVTGDQAANGSFPAWVPIIDERIPGICLAVWQNRQFGILK